jgi:DNA-binding transcriptional LysR family regulator
MATKTKDRAPRDPAGVPAKNTIDSRRLLYFYHVARTGSFSTAETILGVAQSAITRQIQQLEGELDTKLLERHGRGVTLTQFGEILFAQATEILSEMASTLDQLRVARNRTSGQVSIAAFASIMPMLMPQIVTGFRKIYPEVEIAVIQSSTGEVYDQLATGQVDVAILTQPPISKKILQQKLLIEPMYLIVGAQHPLAKRTIVDREDFATLEMIMPSSPHGLRLTIDDYFRANGIEVLPLLRSDSTAFTKELIRQGTFCTVLPELAFHCDRDTEGLVAVPFKQKFLRSVHVASLQDRSELPLVAALTKEVVAVFRQHQLRSRGR